VALRTPAKSAARQAALLHHLVRHLLVRQRIMLVNALRGHLGEVGIIADPWRVELIDRGGGIRTHDLVYPNLNLAPVSN
jgi:transposase